MLQSITLRHYKSFGDEQTIPLEPITVLVGPNNSGKSSFMSVGRLVSTWAHLGFDAVVFQGRTTVRTLASAFLDQAYARGVRRALFAIDNDGGLKRRPEHDVLKKLLYGGIEPSSARRLALALDLVNRPDALDRLRHRKSFLHFERQLREWATTLG